MDALTSTQAARRAGVAVSTIKRWADQGLLPFVRTAGGHRRFDARAIDQFLRAQAGPVEVASRDAAWIERLLAGRPTELDAALAEARARLGAWDRVADELGAALAALGDAWAGGRLSVTEEHLASELLSRGLSRTCDTLPTHAGARCCALACVDDEEHTLGLALAELCLRARGWATCWLGRKTPLAELVAFAGRGQAAMIALSSSSASRSPEALAEVTRRLEAACRRHRVDLVLGGAGPWPAAPAHAVRLTSFAAFDEHLNRLEHRP
ncbi:MAG: helix-turn-helix domain-containing protein [Nannocystaceae bacterium]